MVTIDFETKGIEARPNYPPIPVGVAIKRGGKKGVYLAWGHPEGNNCDEKIARAQLRDIFNSGEELLFHNANFDLDVATTHFGLPMPDWSRIHDTLYLLFLNDPHATSLSLKPSAERILGLPPDERDAVTEWLVEHKIIPKNHAAWQAGANISAAPASVVGPYAIGDVDRTYALFKKVGKLDAGMCKAYERERRLMPILLANEREGLYVDMERLGQDIVLYEKALQKADEFLRRTLGAPSLNIGSNDDLADALASAGVVTEFALTKTGRRSVAKKSLTRERFEDVRVYQAIGYRNRLETCLSVFMKPWYEMAFRNGGKIFTRWNQVRQGHGDEKTGTRTGRLSCSPNFQNLPKDWYDKGDGYEHPKFLKVPELPLIRKYIKADPKQVFGHRDYNQQEFRILAHFEDGSLMEQYLKDPKIDFHTMMQGLIRDIAGIELDRRPVKILNFGLAYGMGIGKLAAGIGKDIETAKRLKAAQLAAVPGLRILDRGIKAKAREGLPIRTWGGRLYYCEPPRPINGILRSFEYKLLNYLIQGSAADCTKEAIIRYHEHPKRQGRFLVTVHDEINFSAPAKIIKREMAVLKECMESVEFDVPMTSDGKYGPTWGDLKEKCE